MRVCGVVMAKPRMRLKSVKPLLPPKPVLLRKNSSITGFGGNNGFTDFKRILGFRSEEHTSELQSPDHLVCRLLLEKKKTITFMGSMPRSLSCAVSFSGTTGSMTPALLLTRVQSGMWVLARVGWQLSSPC